MDQNQQIAQYANKIFLNNTRQKNKVNLNVYLNARLIMFQLEKHVKMT